MEVVCEPARRAGECSISSRGCGPDIRRGGVRRAGLLPLLGDPRAWGHGIPPVSSRRTCRDCNSPERKWTRRLPACHRCSSDDMMLTSCRETSKEGGMGVPAPTREPRVVAPRLLYETRPSDENDYRGAAPSVPYDPAFIRPFTREVETPDSTGRMGSRAGRLRTRPSDLPAQANARSMAGSASASRGRGAGRQPPRDVPARSTTSPQR